MNGIIYVVKNKMNGKHYVGQTIRKFEQRKQQHITQPGPYSIFDKAIKKYGPDNFEWEVIEDNIEDQELLDRLERLHIIRYESLTTLHGYNIREGGNGGRASEETKRRQSIAQSGPRHSQYGIPKSLDTRRKISDNMTGKYRGTRYKNIKRCNPWTKQWQTRIRWNGYLTSLGYFNDPISGQIVYDLVKSELYR